jgi:hypothetical protein
MLRKTYQIILNCEDGETIISTPYESIYHLKQAYNAFALSTDGIRQTIIENTVSRNTTQKKVSIVDL